MICCGEALVQYIDILQKSSWRLGNEDIQAMYDTYKSFLRFWNVCGLPQKPQSHFMIHLLVRSAWSGNPTHYATWEDEGLNKHIVSIGAACHKRVWELRVLTYFAELETSRNNKRARVARGR